MPVPLWWGLRYLSNIEDKRTQRPAQALRGMRPAEPCFVVELAYEIARDGSYHTVAK